MGIHLAPVPKGQVPGEFYEFRDVRLDRNSLAFGMGVQITLGRVEKVQLV